MYTILFLNVADITSVQKEHGDTATIGTYYGSGNSFSAAAGRVSYPV